MEKQNKTIGNWVVAGGYDLEPGCFYEVRHSRKGRFDVLLMAIEGEWATVQIIDGVAQMRARFTPNATAGDVLTLRDIFTYWIKLTSTSDKLNDNTP